MRLHTEDSLPIGPELVRGSFRSAMMLKVLMISDFSWKLRYVITVDTVYNEWVQRLDDLFI